MQLSTVTQRSATRCDEPVRHLLKKKGHTIWSISPDATVYQAIEMMSAKHVGALMVMSAGNLVGIISERDYARKVILRGRNSHYTQVKEIMNRPVMFVSPGQTVDACMRLMTDRHVRHLPVVEGDHVLGVVSIGDVVNWLVESQEQEIHRLENYITGSYPG